MISRNLLLKGGLAAVVAALAPLVSACEHAAKGRDPTGETAPRPAGLAHDLVEGAGAASLSEGDLELVYNLLERDALAISVEDRLTPGLRLEYRAPSQRSRWLQQLAQYFELAPLPRTYAGGEVVLTSNDVLFERTGVGGVSLFGAVHDYDAKTERLSLWGVERAERGPDPGLPPQSHHEAHGVAAKVATVGAPGMVKTRLGRVSRDGQQRTIRDALLRLRITDAAVLPLLRQAPPSSALDLANQSWPVSKVVRKVETREIVVTQRVSIANGNLTVVRESADPASVERYEAKLETVSLISDVHASLPPGEWRFVLAGGSGRARHGSGWRLHLSGVDHVLPSETTVALIPLTFATKVEAEAARRSFMAR